VAFWYSCRWLIEEYHKCLKTGCRIEARQLGNGPTDRGVAGDPGGRGDPPAAVEASGEGEPRRPGATHCPRAVRANVGAHLKQSPERLTTRQFWRETARLGGFLGRTGDGDPGWLTLWRGWQHLETLTRGMELARRMT